jgi:hypothetical protein
MCGKHIFNTLVDTGATNSMIDPTVIPILHLQSQVITPDDPTKVIELANGWTTPCVGTVRVRFQPVTTPDDESSLQVLPEHTHSFQIMTLQPEHQFVMGKDLIHRYWPEMIPTRLIGPPPLDEHLQDKLSISAVTPTVLINLPNTSPTPSDQSLYPISHGLAKHKLDLLNLENDQNQARPLAETEGLGGVPSDEEPVKVQSLTPVELEKEYAIKRTSLLTSPKIQEALSINGRIVGVCNLPESVLKIELDPELGKPTNLHQHQYKLAQALLEPAGMVIDRWLAEGKIKLAPPDCPYNTPVMVAPKKDEQGTMTGIRVCLDLRRINRAVVNADQFQIPLIRSALELLSGCSIFGEFDLAEAYLQVPLHPDSQPLTAFTWGRQKYMFTVCPFGLTQMPSHFQRLMTYIFRDFNFTLPYFDNIPFGSHTWEAHASHILAIVERLNSFNMRIKPSSVKVGQAQLNCLGHLMTRSGIAIARDKLAKLADWPLPKDGKQMASFLGFATFLRQHVRHFGDLTADLESLKRLGKTSIKWTPSLTRSYELVRKAIASAPLLAFPDFTKRFRIASDASCVGIGGVLYQCDADDGIGVITPNNIIAICSKKLNDTQRRYSTYKKELYAIVYCLRQFHSWIWGHDLTIITDHMPLTHIQQTPTLAPAMQQWLDVILDYQFDIVHCPGVTNVLADSLSRMYEALYDTAWGVPSRDRQQLIKELDLRLDPNISVGPDRPRTRLPSPQQQLDPAPGPGRSAGQRHVAAASSGKVGGEIIISVSASDIDSDESTPSPVKKSNLKRVRKQPTSISHSSNTPKQQAKRVRYTIPTSGSVTANEPNEDDDSDGYSEVSMDTDATLPENDKLIIKPSTEPNAGNGCFTVVPLKPHQHIMDYEGDHLDLTRLHLRHPLPASRVYVWGDTKNWYIDATFWPQAFARYMNTSRDRNKINVKFYPDYKAKRVRVRALRAIAAGEELFVNYNRKDSLKPHGSIRGGFVHGQRPLSARQQRTDANSFSSSHPRPISCKALTAEQRDTALLVELERRGKVSPASAARRNELIDKSHLAGHFGRDAIYRQLYRDGYWWPGMRNSINERTRECVPCLRYTVSRMGFDPATPITAALPFDHIQIDTSVKLPPSADGLQAILAIVDVCAGFVLLRPMVDATALSVARVLWLVFTDFGFPRVIQSDNGPEYVNEVIAAMIEISCVEHRLITPYNPRADGKVERSIGVAMSIVKKQLHGADTNWPLFVPWAQACMNNKISSLTGSTPFALMFGRRFHPFRDYSSDAPLEIMDEKELAILNDRMIQVIYPSIAERVAAQKGQLASQLDKRPRAHAFKKGTIVMLRKTNPDGSNITGKFEPVYVGPYQVASKSRHGAITLMSPTGAILPRLVRPHHLKFVSGPSKTFLDQVFEVESIQDHRGSPGNREYLVRWTGFTSADDSWEPESNIHTDECIRSYWDSKPIDTAVRSASAAASVPNPSVAALSTESYDQDCSSAYLSGAGS